MSNGAYYRSGSFGFEYDTGHGSTCEEAARALKKFELGNEPEMYHLHKDIHQEDLYALASGGIDPN